MAAATAAPAASAWTGDIVCRLLAPDSAWAKLTENPNPPSDGAPMVGCVHLAPL